MLLPNLLTLEVLIRCHCRSEDFSPSPAATEALRFLRRVGAVEISSLDTTAFGRAWILAMMRTPTPTVAFLDAKGNVLP